MIQEQEDYHEPFAVYHKLKCNDGIVRTFFVGWRKHPMYGSERGFTRCMNCGMDWGRHGWIFFIMKYGKEHSCKSKEASSTTTTQESQSK